MTQNVPLNLSVGAVCFLVEIINFQFFYEGKKTKGFWYKCFTLNCNLISYSYEKIKLVDDA